MPQGEEPMSRNFELLKQLEIEVDVTDERPRIADERPRIADERPRIADERPRIADERPRVADDRVISKELSPEGISDTQGEEMLTLAQTIFLSTTGRTARQIV